MSDDTVPRSILEWQKKATEDARRIVDVLRGILSDMNYLWDQHHKGVARRGYCLECYGKIAECSCGGSDAESDTGSYAGSEDPPALP